MTSLVSLEIGDYIDSLGGTDALTGYLQATDASKAAWFTSLDDAQAVTKGAVEARIGQIIDNAPAALDTLNELATALGNDASFSTTITNTLTSIGNDIAQNQTDISTNAGNITTNITNIASNLTSINTNTADIATNSTDINTNAASIATNSTDINTNTADIATNTADIATNVTNIGNNLTEITTNQTDISTNAGNITTNITNIASNLTSINNNAADIATNTADIATNTADIASLSNNTTTNIGTAIDALTTAVFSPSGEDIFGVDVLGNPNVYTLSDWKTKYDPNTVFTALQSVAGEDLVNSDHANAGTNGFIVLQNYSSSSGAIQWQLHLSEDDKSLNWVDMESGRTMFKLKPE